MSFPVITSKSPTTKATCSSSHTEIHNVFNESNLNFQLLSHVQSVYIETSITFLILQNTMDVKINIYGVRPERFKYFETKKGSISSHLGKITEDTNFGADGLIKVLYLQ